MNDLLTFMATEANITQQQAEAAFNALLEYVSNGNLPIDELGNIQKAA
jgi:hypothetical protein